MNRSEKIYIWLNKELGVNGAILILLFVVLAAYGINEKIDLNRKQAYATGTSLGVKKGVKGN